MIPCDCRGCKRRGSPPPPPKDDAAGLSLLASYCSGENAELARELLLDLYAWTACHDCGGAGCFETDRLAEPCRTCLRVGLLPPAANDYLPLPAVMPAPPSPRPRLDPYLADLLRRTRPLEIKP